MENACLGEKKRREGNKKKERKLWQTEAILIGYVLYARSEAKLC